MIFLFQFIFIIDGLINYIMLLSLQQNYDSEAKAIERNKEASGQRPDNCLGTPGL